MNNQPLSIGFVTVADLPEGCGRTGRLRTMVGALAGTRTRPGDIGLAFLAY